MRFKNVFFIQDQEANEFLEHLDNYGPKATINYILDMIQEETLNDSDITNENPAGNGDSVFDYNGYSLVWNFRLDYIGLSRKIPNETATQEQLELFYKLASDQTGYYFKQYEELLNELFNGFVPPHIQDIYEASINAKQFALKVKHWNLSHTILD